MLINAKVHSCAKDLHKFNLFFQAKTVIPQIWQLDNPSGVLRYFENQIMYNLLSSFSDCFRAPNSSRLENKTSRTHAQCNFEIPLGLCRRLAKINTIPSSDFLTISYISTLPIGLRPVRGSGTTIFSIHLYNSRFRLKQLSLCVH